MSVVNCSVSDHYVDSDEGTIEVWEPRIVCENCFQKMDPVEVWNLATEAAAKIAEDHEKTHTHTVTQCGDHVAKKIREGVK